MKNSRLVVLLQTLSNKEWRELDRFVRSPYFNRNEEVVRLWGILQEHLQELKIMPEKERLFHRLFPNASTYDDQQIRLLMSYLLKLTETFLVQQEQTQDHMRSHTVLTAQYRKRQLPRHYAYAWKQAQQARERHPYRNADFFQDAFRLETEHYRFQAATNRIREFNLQEVADSLDIVFISQKLRQACSMLSHQAVYKTEYDFGLLDQILIYVEARALLDLPAISVYYYCYRALTQPEEPRFFHEFKNLILTWSLQFPPDEMRDLFILGINFCIKRYNEGAGAYLEDEFELYREGLDRGILLSEGQLSRFTYRNAVTLGIVRKEYAWVEQFLYDYRNALPPPHRESMFSFCLALLEYSRQEYEKALNLLQKTEYEDLLLNLAAKTVQIKIFYEWGETDLLYAHLEAMRTFIRRKKGIGYHQENYLHTIQLTRRLLEVNPFDRQALQDLRKEIEQTRYIAEKSWLLTQVDLLEKN